MVEIEEYIMASLFEEVKNKPLAESIDKKYHEKYGKGIPGSVWDRIKSDENYAREFESYLDNPPDLNKIDKAEATKMSNMGMLDLAEWTIANDKRTKSSDYDSSIDNAIKNGYVTEDIAQAYKDLYRTDEGAATGWLSKVIQEGIEKKNFVEPEYVTQARKLINEQMNSDPTFNTGIIDEWMPTLLKTQEGAKQQEYQNNADLQNQMGRLFSGQTLKTARDTNTAYNMDALNKALGYASSDYARKLTQKDAAINKNLALGQYDQDRNFQSLMNSFNMAESNRATAQSMLEQNLSNIWGNEAWEKNASLQKELMKMQTKDNGFDWTKLLQPAATVAAAAI